MLYIVCYIKVSTCPAHRVRAGWSAGRVSPGAPVSLSVSSRAGSLCALSATDKVSLTTNNNIINIIIIVVIVIIIRTVTIIPIFSLWISSGTLTRSPGLVWRSSPPE